MTGYTERTVSLKTECLIKVQTFYYIYAAKSQQDGWIKFTKKYLWSVVYQHKIQPLSKVSACCRCSLQSWLLDGKGLLAWCNCRKHYYFSGLLQVQQTAQMVGYCYNKYEYWSGASVPDMHACRHKFTDMTVGKMQLLKTWEMAGCNCYSHGWCSAASVIYMDHDKNETVTDMHADNMQLINAWLLVRCNCKIHAWWSGAIVLTSPLVGYEHIWT